MTRSVGATLPVDAHAIRTDRLLLRPLTEADADDVFSYQSLPEAVRYLPWPLRDREESREHTLKRAGFTRLANDKDAIILAAELPGPDGEPGPVIGDLSIFLQSAVNAQVSIGWVFHPILHGRGYATEAARAVLEFVFTEIGAHRVFAEVDPRNTPSVALCRRLGMRLEGILVENEIFKGEWSDLAVFAILDREWGDAR
ncbi:Protein N-acetyltransferase, RimJ/RimL family [Cryobacterium psychrotolerans]|uniref:Protein N-acetyltransferase, RimJ/RimL family n=1 Tax=Cryobacterium psychrotolerans TaxID=386301 RepID=A0A1G9B257_9MICO|nr:MULTISPECIES: GNAT family protein [Cryobacterium]TFD46298.1 N-acetyltransferase [Cryobacterium sp. TMT1-2-1]TFD84606.1 N-acetyltransferase [Cryobacterium psychrotolerans]SDK33622.1 Protein N-acetyltransferase, RimJ/RimL family [Cryobacterium psychrotolerans]